MIFLVANITIPTIAARMVIVPSLTLVYGAPILFRLWNIYHAFYINFLKVKIQDTTDVTPEAMQVKQRLEKRLRIAMILNSTWVNILAIVFFLILYVLIEIILFIYMGINLQSVLSSATILNLSVLIEFLIFIVIFISISVVLLVLMVRIKVADIYGVVRSIVISIVVIIISILLLLAFLIQSFVRPNDVDARCYIFQVLGFIISLEALMYVLYYTIIVCFKS
jgi:hypothetical protein